MKRSIRTTAGVILLSLFFLTAMAATAHAQLILTNMKMKIVKVEREFNRLQARVHDGGNTNIQWIMIDGNTKFSHNEKPVSYDEAWQMFRKDMIVRVKGGYTVTGRVKAKTIYW